MKICFVCNEYPPHRHGGIGSFVCDMAHYLVASGHEVWVVGYAHSESEDVEDGIKVLRIKPPLGSGYFLFFRKRFYLSSIVRQLAKSERFDLVEVAEYEGEMPFFNWPLRASCPLLVRYHLSQTVIARLKSTRVSLLISYFEKIMLLQADYRVAVSDHIDKNSVACFGDFAQADKVIYNSVDTDLFSPAKEQMRIPGRILFLGKVSHNKGVHLLFEELPVILSALPDVTLDIVGSDTQESPQRESYIQYLLGKLSDEHRARVRYLGRVDRALLPDIYRCASCCIFPSLVEAHSIAWLEAMSCGTPCILSGIAGGYEYIKQNKDAAIVIDPTQKGSIAMALSELLYDKEKIARISKLARSEVLSRFCKENILAENITFYEKVTFAH